MCIKLVLKSTINCMQYVSRTLKCTVGHNCGLTPFIDVFIEEVPTTMSLRGKNFRHRMYSINRITEPTVCPRRALYNNWNGR